MATINKIPVNGKLPKSVIWDGKTVKQIWINIPSYDHPYADEEKNLLYKNDEQFIFVTNMEHLKGLKLAENTLVFKGFSANEFKGKYITIAKGEPFPTKPAHQMVVKNSEGEN